MTHLYQAVPARRGAIALFVLLTLSGCALDPYTRDGNWRPSGSAEANLRMQVADPRDYQQGASERGSDGQFGADAVSRLRASRSGQVTPPALPAASSSAGVSGASP